MILIDFSSVVHRMIHATVARNKPTLVDGKYVTSDYVGIVEHYILEELLKVKTQYGKEFGEIVLCLDNSSVGLWRRDVYPGYKASRKKARDESPMDFKELFAKVDDLVDGLRQYSPWKVIEVPRAEADDVIMILAKQFANEEKILIYSPDKDFIQCQRWSDNIKQYSPKTNEWIVPENKHDGMDHWLVEHVCLGDAIDCVPKVVDFTEFTDVFLEYLETKGLTIRTPWEFTNSDLTLQEKREILGGFTVMKTSRTGEVLGPDVYKTIKFGPVALQKAIESHGSVDAWLDQHPILRKNYERNYTLVMEEGIPDDIRNETLLNFSNAPAEYKPRELETFLRDRNLRNIAMLIPSHFKITRDLTAEDFGW